jgi:hypothetical protein
VTRAALRGILLALLGALIAGFVAGTWLRLRFERPVRYLGALGPAARGPLDVLPPGPAVLDARQHEEQVG